MDPTQSGHMVLKSLLDKQWFVAGVIIFFFIVFVAGAVWLANLIKTGLKENQERLDAIIKTSQDRQDSRDKEWFARMDKRDDENKEMVHSYYNSSSTASLTYQATGQAVTGLGGAIEDLTESVRTLERTVESKWKPL